MTMDVMLHRYGSYGSFAQAHSVEWMHASDGTPVTRDEAWQLAVAALQHIHELNYLTTIVCRVFEVQGSQSGDGCDVV